MHNGLMLPIFDNKLKNLGLINPNGILFPKLSRGNYKISKNTDVIISGGVIKFSKKTKLSKLNSLFKSHIEYIYI